MDSYSFLNKYSIIYINWVTLNVYYNRMDYTVLLSNSTNKNWLIEFFIVTNTNTVCCLRIESWLWMWSYIVVGNSVGMQCKSTR